MYGEHSLAPNADGWFMSDFLLFQHLLNGVGSSQHWLCAEGSEPAQVWGKYKNEDFSRGGYLHEEPTSSVPLKVVLDDDVLRSGTLPTCQTHPTRTLLRKFLELIQAESRIAGVLGHSLALFVFGHGERNDFGIHIGNPEANDEFSHVWLTLAALSEYLDPGVSTILFSTSCFSGGWAVDPTVNITAMAAAGPTTEALSWYGDSVRRFNGGIYATTVQQLLIKRGPEERLGKENVQFESGWSTPAAEYSYSEWSRSVHESTFRDTDSPASYHDIKFSAQDDNWGQNFTERTGIPLSVYKERWNALKDYGNSQMTSPMTRNPQFKQSGGNPLVPFLLHNSMRGSTSTSTKGEKMPALHSFVRNMARDYLASFPGMDSLGTNSKQGRIREFAFADKNVVVSIERLEFFLHWLMYRLGLLDLSNDFVLRAGIPKPLGLGVSLLRP